MADRSNITKDCPVEAIAHRLVAICEAERRVDDAPKAAEVSQQLSDLRLLNDARDMLEEQASWLHSKSLAGAMMQIILAHADLASVLSTHEIADLPENRELKERLARADRYLWGAGAALNGQDGVCYQKLAGDYYPDDEFDPIRLLNALAPAA